MILVTGAHGKTGQAIIEALLKQAVPIRAWVYREKYMVPLLQLGVTECIAGDMQDPAVWAQAVAGCAAVYLICPNMHPQELNIAELAVTALKKSGNGRLVYHSVLHPQSEKMPHHWQKMRVEEMLLESNLPFTILQPAAYMQNILGSWEQIKQGSFPVPYNLESRISIVDLNDVAAAAAIVLTDPVHNYAIYELAGPEALSQHEVAAALSRYLNHPVTATQIPLAEWQTAAKKNGLSGYPLHGLLQMFAYYDQYGFRGSPFLLTQVIGRPPASFATFLATQSF